jgi:hypothetical protein
MAKIFRMMYASFICSLNVDPQHALQQQHIVEQHVIPAQHTASVASVKHINLYIV